MSFFDGLSKRVSEGVNAMQSNFKKNNFCTSCSISFNITRSKKFCSSCKEPYCSACLIKRPENPNEKRCKRCLVFSRHELVWEELMRLRVKDLIWFLNRQNISSQGLKEKEQLAELILDYYGNEEYHRRRVTRERKIAERLMAEDPSPQRDDHTNNETPASHPNPSTSHNRSEEEEEHIDDDDDDQPQTESLPIFSDPEVPIAAPDILPPPYNAIEDEETHHHPTESAPTQQYCEASGASDCPLSSPNFIPQSNRLTETLVEEKPASTLLKGGTEVSDD